MDIANKIEKLEKEFDRLRTQIKNELSTEVGMNVKQLLDTLTSLPLTLKKEYESSITKSIHDLRVETQVDEVFIHLNPLISFIDYGLIEFFIKKYGSDRLKDQMRSYCSEMKIFMKETTIKQLIDYFPGQPEIPPKFSLVEAKIGQNASKCTLEQLNNIRRKYCSEVRLSEIVFYLVAVVDSNSFIVRWLVPQVLVSDIMNRNKSIESEFFQEHRITLITLDEMWLYVNETELEVMWLHLSNAKLIYQFHNMHKQIVLGLKIEKTSINELSRCLIDRQPNLQEDTSIFLSEAVMNYLFFPSGCFVDFEMLKIIVEQFGGDCLKRVMKSYCSFMSIFTKQTTAQQLLDLPPAHTKNFVKAECRIIKARSGYTCDDIVSLKNSICSEIDISRLDFALSQIRNPVSGSFSVIWLVPTFLASDLIKSASRISSTFYVRNSIKSLSIGNRWVYNIKLISFGSKLKKQYQQFHRLPSPVEWIPSPTKKIFRLAMIQKERVQQGHIEDRFVQMTISGRVDDILFAKLPVEVEHIFANTLHGNEIILIEGAPGSGKSTLAVHICQRWGKGELFQQFTAVILVQL